VTTWRLRPDLVRVAVPPRRARLSEAGVIVLPADGPHLGPFIGVVTQVGRDVRDLKPGVGVVFGSLVGQWWDGDLLIAVADLDAVLE
jgi:hypothetical protein